MTGIAASGTAYAAVLRALEDLGIDEAVRQLLGLRLLRLSMPWPLDRETARRLCRGLRDVVVVEEKTSFIESQLKEALYGQADPPRIVGKEDEAGRPLVARSGAVTAELVTRVLAARLPAGDLPESVRRRMDALLAPRPTSLQVRALPARTPYFCSGCPHNVSTQAPDDQLVGVGIGCHIMAALRRRGRGHLVGMTQMGGEGAQWNGLAPFTDDRHYVQNLGDGTFFHSGSLAVRAAVAAGVDITYKLLYNDAVAMTGGQAPEGRLDVPGAGAALGHRGGAQRWWSPPPSPSATAGWRCDPVATVRHRDELAVVAEELARTRRRDGAVPRRSLRRRGATAAQAGEVGGPDQPRLDQPAGLRGLRRLRHRLHLPVGGAGGHRVRVARPRSTRARATRTTAASGVTAPPSCWSSPAAGAVPTPPPSRSPWSPPAPAAGPPDRFLVRMPGVGGTGVVTVSRILQMAAHLDGRWAAGLDQTGLAQKGGPVVSDLRISSEEVVGGARASARTADLLLGLDLLGAAAEENLAAADAGRTVAVVSTSVVATAAMVTGAGDARRPPGVRRARPRRSTGAPVATRTSSSTHSGSPSGCSTTTCRPTWCWSGRRSSTGACPSRPRRSRPRCG